ncbi:copper amine oxidase N-terminal domain-containing protein [Desulfoscipio gibsoniae]|uniref:Copper amine oxidase family protein n=1 Tax=Desulfoscipio gibsoniae DSM 7213 TaxID=767817 RepID=R4KPP6_9FIRM|nr:copper amine oxidase N-terminal domain-containing protein [Desulfoscipio gibsoniae]AGL02535.1 copper amine oxidase family protein [Desulfoscipio gibsoniae DSM 7213]
MKKALTTGVLAILIILIMSYPAMAKENDIQVKINSFFEWGEIVQNNLEFGNKEKPRTEHGRVFIPLRKISEYFGYTVIFNEEAKKVNLVDSNGKKVELTLYSKKAIVNNKTVEMDVPAKMINQVTFVPLRFISENFDQAVKWDPSTRTVFIDHFIISTPDYLFNQKTLELTKRDESGKGKHLALGKIPMSVDWVSMHVAKTKNGNDVIVIDNNSGAPHLYHDLYTIYVSETNIIDQSVVNTLFSGKAVISSDGEKVVIGDGKIARVYDDKTKKLQYEYDLQSLFEAEKDPNPDGFWKTSYAILGFEDNYILVKDTFKMLTKMVYLDTKKIVNIYEVVLSKEEQEEALQNAGPFGNGDRLKFIEEKDGKLIFNRFYDDGPYTKTKIVEYSLENL